MHLRRWTALIALLAITLLPGTAAGERMVRTSERDGQGPLIPDCRNVSNVARNEVYRTNSYLSTWGSALLEGATQGLGEGLAGEGEIAEAIRRATVRPSTEGNLVFNELPRRFSPYCRAYTGSRQVIARSVGEILPLLGNPVELSDEDTGIFRTGIIDRRHPMAQWKDSYLITVEEAEPNRIIVRVLRTLYISRDGTTYNRGISSGQNELWIFTQIADRYQRVEAEQAAAAAEATRREAAAAEARRNAAAAQAARRDALTTRYGAAIANAIATGRVIRGMTMEQVVEARGQPERRERISGSEELWSYGSQRVVFINRRVTHVSN
jgi:hypothetical protein